LSGGKILCEAAGCKRSTIAQTHESIPNEGEKSNQTDYTQLHLPQAVVAQHFYNLTSVTWHDVARRVANDCVMHWICVHSCLTCEIASKSLIAAFVHAMMSTVMSIQAI